MCIGKKHVPTVGVLEYIPCGLGVGTTLYSETKEQVVLILEEILIYKFGRGW